MPLLLSPITPSDTLAWTRIRNLAYAGPTHNLVHSNQPLSEPSLVAIAEDRRHEINKLNTWHFKITDTDLAPTADDSTDSPGRIIAIAVWSLKNTQITTSEHEDAQKQEQQQVAPSPPAYTPPQLRLDALASLLAPLRATQLATMGTKTPYLMLHSLATHPQHQGRGAASLLLAWGLRKADEEGLSVYLDCTAMARVLYEKRGFELVGEYEWDRSQWGGEGRDWYGSMVRWAGDK